MIPRTEILEHASRLLTSVPFERGPLCDVLVAWVGAAHEDVAIRIVETLIHGRREGRRPRASELVPVLRRDPWVAEQLAKRWPDVPPLQRPRMIPTAGAPSGWKVVPLVTLVELADHLGVTLAGLDRMRAPARRSGCERDQYHRSWVGRGVGRAPRLIEAPKPRLKAVQRCLTGLLRRIPTHDAVHGFVPGRGPSTLACEHAGQRCVVRIDVVDCFASVGRGWVRRLWMDAGYPEAVADALADLCTTATPPAALPASCRWSETRRVRFLRRHVPQGAPCSPDLINRCLYRLDTRLAGLARRFGATYGRYADDLVFSGGERFSRDAGRLEARVAAVLDTKGLEVGRHKTRIMRRGVRQHVAGLSVNLRAAVPRAERDELRAILHNCVRHGASGQNRAGHADFRAHLRGRIARVAAHHPSLGSRMIATFSRIRW